MMLTLSVLALFLLTSAVFVLALLRIDRGQKEPVGALFMAFCFGVLAIGLSIVLELRFVKEMGYVGYADLRLLSFMSLKVSVIEELAKFVPLALFIYRKAYFNEHTDGVLYFSIAGLAFGLVENILYTVQFGAEVGAARLVLTPLFHAATTGLIGAALIRVKLDGRPWWRLAMTVISIIVIHAVYNFGMQSGLPIFVVASIAVTFILVALLWSSMFGARSDDRRVQRIYARLVRRRRREQRLAGAGQRPAISRRSGHKKASRK